jgi:hypothetical protein
MIANSLGAFSLDAKEFTPKQRKDSASSAQHQEERIVDLTKLVIPNPNAYYDLF